MRMLQERWRAIPGYSAYQVSSFGRIMSTRKAKTPKLMKGGVDGCGYRNFSLTNDVGTKTMYVHRLVLEAFHGPARKGQMCRHLDGNPANNHISNLRWGSGKENYLDSVKHGTAVPRKYYSLDLGGP